MATTCTITQPRGQVRPVYLVTCPVDGLAPQRLPSSDETDRGIVSFDPPTARAFEVQGVIDATIAAVSLAWTASGQPLDMPGYVCLATRVALDVKRAILATDPTVDV